jgi:hypothetical protein
MGTFGAFYNKMIKIRGEDWFRVCRYASISTYLQLINPMISNRVRELTVHQIYNAVNQKQIELINNIWIFYVEMF